MPFHVLVHSHLCEYEAERTFMRGMCAFVRMIMTFRMQTKIVSVLNLVVSNLHPKVVTIWIHFVSTFGCQIWMQYHGIPGNEGFAIKDLPDWRRRN